jgi:hypothetical protein
MMFDAWRCSYKRDKSKRRFLAGQCADLIATRERIAPLRVSTLS